MCGIIGYCGKNVDKIDISILKKIKHRGPDDSGHYNNEDIWFGHQRLSIIDLSINGHQPIISNDGNFILIYNGEIYNHLIIREKLIIKGYTFKSQTDSETLLYALIEFGTSVLENLNGIFAFGFYKKKENEIIIARDQFGVKPLYYFHQNEFGFSSELKALIELPGFNKELNINAFVFYLQMLYSPGEITPFKNVKKLLPGHYLTYNILNNNLKSTKYYNLEYAKSKKNRSEIELIDELDLLLVAAVKRQLMSDVPIGYFLSGGLDSSLITAIACKLNSEKYINCFTISTGRAMINEGFSDDLYYAKKVAEYLNVKLNIITAVTNMEEFFDKMIWHLDEPQADPAPMHVYNIAYAAKQMGIKVLMSGTGGDDIFSGYRRHQAIEIEKYLKFIPRIFLKYSSNISLMLINSKSPKIRRIKKLLKDIAKSINERISGYYIWIEKDTVMNLFNKESKNKINSRDLPDCYMKELLKKLPDKIGLLDQMLFLEMSTFLPDHNLNYTDKMSMAAGVETRVPFLDLDLVNFANSLPIEFKMKNGTTKYLLRKVAERYLPKDIIYRSKTGFGAPIRTWLKTSMKPMVLERLSAINIEKEGLFDYKEISKLLNSYFEGKVDASYTIWALMSIDSWIKQFTNINE